MNKIIESFLQTHIKEYELDGMTKETAFEHFINRCIINKYATDRVDPSVIMTDSGEKGLDGVAIIVNDRIICDEAELQSVISESNKLEVRFVFIQSKTSENFSASEIGDFLYGVKAFFETKESRPITNPKMENLIKLKDIIYTHGVDFDPSPIVDAYYVCCGKWNDGNGLISRVNIDLKPLRESDDYSQVNFYPYDSEKIIITYKELKKKVAKSFQMDKRVAFPMIEGVTQAYLGMVRCKDFVSILRDSDGRMLTNIFEDNVRDFQGYNSVNSEIKATIEKTEDQNRFALLNNGITIMAKSIKVTGDMIQLFDYQIVNGCQTSYVLFDNAERLTENSYIVLKIIEVSDEKISDRIIFTTNRQTEVKAEAFTSTKPFHKRLQDFYDAVEAPYRLFYERRSKQYDLDDSIAKSRIVTLASQTAAYIAIFLNEPHSTHRYYGELLQAYENKLFLETDSCETYYIAAYLLYYLDMEFKLGKIPKEYKRYKYHLACAIKALEVGSHVIFGQWKKQKKEFDKLYALIKDEERLSRKLKSAISCLDKALESCSEIPQSDQYRSKEVTKELLNNVISISEAEEDKTYLMVGDIVHCVVESISESFVNVTIRTEDSRNYGSIHISQVADRYIPKLSDEVKLAETFQAKIIADFYESRYGWKLTRLYK